MKAMYGRSNKTSAKGKTRGRISSGLGTADVVYPDTVYDPIAGANV